MSMPRAWAGDCHFSPLRVIGCRMRLGYLYSRYPVISQTFCDAEMLALERHGIDLVIGSVHPPLTSLRHEYIAKFRAPIHYAQPQQILKISEKNAKTGRAKWQW